MRLNFSQSIERVTYFSAQPFYPNIQPIMGSNDPPSVVQYDAASFGSEPLLTLPNGHSIDLARGYIPLLARFTHEDKAAKGLRKRKAGQKPEPPIHFSAVELVRDNKILLLTGPSGSGKTSFAKHLCFQLRTEGLGKRPSLVRNELGDIREEVWDARTLLPHYYVVSSAGSLKPLIENTIPSLLVSARTNQSSEQDGILIVLDGVEKADHEGPGLLATLSEQVERSENIRILLLGNTSMCRHWILPSEIARHELLPLLVSQRRLAIAEILGVNNTLAHIGIGAAAANPSLFALALQAQHPGDNAEDLLDEWLSVAFPQNSAAKSLAAQTYRVLANGFSAEKSATGLTSDLSSNPALLCDAVKQLVAARHLSSLHPDATIQLFHDHPQASQAIIRSCLSRLSTSGRSETLVEGLVTGPPAVAQRGALIVAEFPEASEKFTDRVKNLVLEVVTQGTLEAGEREVAGRILSRLGDPRDLKALASVPAGSFTMGSTSHPNSQPLDTITLSSFRVGMYPVVNQDYLAFIQDTGREWLSPGGADPERQNAPATDLTWHDASAYCVWLTARWRSNGTIGLEEQVRLPTEPEWERTARGDQDDTSIDGPVYPWGTTWQDDTANSEEAGFNSTCAVGLFPRGRSPYGCYDMAGHVWEWCTTLWGEDMATPTFSYPWREDDREVLDAPEQVRRVLRGGCFSSPKMKANCTYRGSLEPSGFWRGNGFRIVVDRSK